MSTKTTKPPVKKAGKAAAKPVAKKTTPVKAPVAKKAPVVKELTPVKTPAELVQERIKDTGAQVKAKAIKDIDEEIKGAEEVVEDLKHVKEVILTSLDKTFDNIEKQATVDVKTSNLVESTIKLEEQAKALSSHRVVEHAATARRMSPGNEKTITMADILNPDRTKAKVQLSGVDHFRKFIR